MNSDSETNSDTLPETSEPVIETVEELDIFLTPAAVLRILEAAAIDEQLLGDS